MTGPGELVVGVDLGGTRFRAAAAPADPTIRVSASVTSLFDRPAPATLGELGAALDAALVAAATHGSVSGMGITVPGLVAGTTCRWVPNLPFLDGVDLAAITSRVAAVGNDANLALLAEASEGAVVGHKDAILVAIGTGIGSAVLAGGRIQLGASGGACSLGWACADVSDPGDDRLGWLERHAAGPVLDALGARLDPPVDGAGLLVAATRGDALASEALRSVARSLGTGLAGAVALLDPGVVIISGGVADGFDVLAPMVRESMIRHLPPHLRATELRRGALGSRAGLVGALIAARSGSETWTAVR